MQAFTLTWRKLGSSAFIKGSTRKFIQTAFSEKYLLFTNVTISISLSSAGDILQQQYEIWKKKSAEWDMKRTMHMGFSGACVGVLCHNWYKILDRVIVGKTIGMVMKKLLLDQLLFSPVMIVTFFGSLALFEDNPMDNFKMEVREKFSILYTAEWMVWPPAQIINFYFLPTRFRVLYDNIISLGYDIYTSRVKHGKSRDIEKESTCNSMT